MKSLMIDVLGPLVKATSHRPWLLFSLAMLELWACGGAASPTTPVSSTLTPDPTAVESATSVPGQAIASRQPPAQPETAIITALPPGSTGLGPTGLGPTGSVPVLDRSMHTVPLRDILFDTFGGNPRFVPLDLATDDFIDQLRDAIRPIDHPTYGPATDLPWLDDDDLVIGYRSQNGAYAYPVNILEFHEIVNDDIDGVPVLITYFPLCFSGVVFSRELGDNVLSFGNTSALYMSDLVMYDKQTGSYWFQVAGEAVVGPLSGSRLDLLPSTTIA